MERGKVNLNECQEGDILISALGAKLKYVRPTNENEYLDHVVEYLEGGLGNGTRTNDGYVFANNRIPETDHDIVKIIPSKKRKKVRWVIQNNLIAENDLNQLQEACKEAGDQVQEILVIPFSDELPEFTHNPNNVYYGSTTLMNNIYRELKPKGLFYDEGKFNMTNYFDEWGGHMLSYGATIATVKEFLSSPDDYLKGKDVFVRPDGDGKEFDGQVATVHEIKGMLERTLKYDGPLNEYSRILVGTAYNIHKEWRLYIVGGEIVTASRYRKDFKLSKDSLDIPEEMLTFAKERLKEYMPHENFAMDICSVHDGEYYIIECGCLNSVGFYHADINKLVKAISKWMKK